MPRAAPRTRDRRRDIALGLYRCISRQGYANTSLKDIASQAGMTPSHVGYYFDNKAAILEHYAAGICARNISELPGLDEPDLDRLIDGLADFCFGEGQMSTGLLGVIQELTGLAVHDPALHRIKADHAVALREYLEAFFERFAPRQALTARDAAQLTHAMLVGLNTNTLFDCDLERQAARRLFRDALRALVNGAGNTDLAVASSMTRTLRATQHERNGR